MHQLFSTFYHVLHNELVLIPKFQYTFKLFRLMPDVVYDNGSD